MAIDPAFELEELAQIYVDRGVEPALARQVAQQMSAKDPLATHARDELGISPATRARPVQAAWASALSFATGAAMPLLVAWLVPLPLLAWSVSLASLAFLALLGVWSARTGGAKVWRATGRVVFWGAFAMAATALVGSLFGAVV